MINDIKWQNVHKIEFLLLIFNNQKPSDCILTLPYSAFLITINFYFEIFQCWTLIFYLKSDMLQYRHK